MWSSVSASSTISRDTDPVTVNTDVSSTNDSNNHVINTNRSGNTKDKEETKPVSKDLDSANRETNPSLSDNLDESRKEEQPRPNSDDLDSQVSADTVVRNSINFGDDRVSTDQDTLDAPRSNTNVDQNPVATATADISQSKSEKGGHAKPNLERSATLASPEDTYSNKLSWCWCQ